MPTDWTTSLARMLEALLTSMMLETMRLQLYTHTSQEQRAIFTHPYETSVNSIATRRNKHLSTSRN
jgi:hypothetical protein